MSNPFSSSTERLRRSIFDDDTDDDPTETNSFGAQSKMNTATIDSHRASSLSTTTSQTIAHLPSPSALQQDNFHASTMHDRPPAYDSPVRAPPPTRTSYDSPANDPWSSTPRTNGVTPVAAPNFPRRTSSMAPPAALGAQETASYLLDADHITIQKSDEKEGLIGFKHVNYTVASARRGTQVVRRYSDFSWYNLLLKAGWLT